MNSRYRKIAVLFFGFAPLSSSLALAMECANLSGTYALKSYAENCRFFAFPPDNSTHDSGKEADGPIPVDSNIELRNLHSVKEGTTFTITQKSCSGLVISYTRHDGKQGKDELPLRGTESAHQILFTPHGFKEVMTDKDAVTDPVPGLQYERERWSLELRAKGSVLRMKSNDFIAGLALVIPFAAVRNASCNFPRVK